MQFRLRDLLVATVVLAGMGALVLPAIQASREAARRTTCANNLKQLGLGIHNYHDTFKRIPPASTGKDAAPRIGWQVRILPFTEQSPLYDQLNMKLPNLPAESFDMWNGPKGGPGHIEHFNLTAEIQYPYEVCPDDHRASVTNGYAQTSYSGNLGSQNTASGSADCQPFDVAGIHFETARGSVLFGDTDDKHQLSGIFSRQTYEPITFADVLDGTPYTFAAGEILGDCHPNETGWWDVDGAGNAHASTSVPLNTKTTCVRSRREAMNRGYFMPQCFDQSNTNFSWGFRSNHPSGANFLLCDGSVVFINNEVDYTAYQRYGGRADTMSSEQ